MWAPPPPPLPRHQVIAQQRAVAAQQRQARRQRVWNELNTLQVPMMPGLRLVQGTNGGAVAQTDARGTIYVDGNVDDFTLAHEAAHNLEPRMTDADKQRFAMLLGRPKQPWEGTISTAPNGSRMESNSGLDERFANMAAMIATRHFPKPGQGGLFDGTPPTRREILRFGRALERFGRRNNLPRYVRPT